MTASPQNRISQEVVEAAMHTVQNSIICKESFKCRPDIIHVRMFDTYTNSNAESEHHALKKKSLGLQANSTLHTLMLKTEIDAKLRHTYKKQQEHQNVTNVDAKTLCTLSTYVTKPCFQAMEAKVLLAQECISKQISDVEWKVIYQRKAPFDANVTNAYLPYMRRIRTVTKNEDGMLQCSCKGYERYGYPCHHLLHVLKCYTTGDILHEWIHIRWTNVYSRYHYSSDSTTEQRALYSALYDSFPVGPKHTACLVTSEFPVYDSYHNAAPQPKAFDVPTFQLMSREAICKTWIFKNNSSDPSLKSLLTKKNDSLTDAYLFTSQENTKFSQSLDDNGNDTFEIDSINDEDEDTSITPLYPQHFNYNTHNVVLKRAVDLCGNDVSAHQRLYDILNEFNIAMEANHNDNQKVFKEKNKDFMNNDKSNVNNDVTLISSNKVVNTLARSTKRTKYSYEKY